MMPTSQWHWLAKRKVAVGMEQVIAFLWKADELYKKKDIKIIYYLDLMHLQ